MGIMMVYFVLTVAVIYPFADEMIMLFVNGGEQEVIARCGVSLWLVPAWAWLGVCYADPVAWMMADLFLAPAYLWLLKRLRKDHRIPSAA